MSCKAVNGCVELVDMYSTFGCLSDEVTLTCSDGTLILITGADYGEYFHPCATTCCAPHPFDDCLEPMAENRYTCMSLQIMICHVLYWHHVFEQCEPGFVVHRP